MSPPDPWDLEQWEWKLLQPEQDGKLQGRNKEGNAFWNLEVFLQFSNASPAQKMDSIAWLLTTKQDSVRKP